MRQPTLLVVDDEPNNFAVIEALLRSRNYRFCYAKDGIEAISSLDEVKPDLILLDVMMPEMDGIEVCQYIKAQEKWQMIPIIMVTALNTKESLSDCLHAGADDFVGKPINAVELRARVHSMLRIKEQYDQNQRLSGIQTQTIQVLENTLYELRGNIASRLSHEINTPLQGVLGAIDLLKSQLHIQIQGPKDAPIAQTLGQVDHAVHRLESLMTKFRIYLELEELVNRPGNLRSENLQAQSLQTTGQPPGQPAEQAMGQLEENLRFSYAIGIAKARAYHHKRVNDLILDMVEAPITLSAKYLSILLDELVDNALKFSNPGTTVTVTSQASGNRMDIWIRDSGRGMTAEQINQVGAFMQFERPTYEQQGMGMGLKIAAKIVELAGGIFAIRQNEPQGTTVQLSLPIPGLNKVG